MSVVAGTALEEPESMQHRAHLMVARSVSGFSYQRDVSQVSIVTLLQSKRHASISLETTY